MNIGRILEILNEQKIKVKKSDLSSEKSLEKHIDAEKEEVSKNFDGTKENVTNIVQNVKRASNNSNGKSPEEQIQNNIDNINALSKDVYNLSFNCDMLTALSVLGLTNGEEIVDNAGKGSKSVKEENSKLVQAITRFIGCSRKYWEPIKKCLGNHFTNENHYTLEQMDKAGTLGNLIGKTHPLHECWKELFYTNAQGIGNGELLLSLLLRGGSLQHTGSGDVTFYPKSTSKDKLGVPVAVEVKAGNSQLPFDLTSENTSKAVARIDALIEGIKNYGEINVNEKRIVIESLEI